MWLWKRSPLVIKIAKITQQQHRLHVNNGKIFVKIHQPYFWLAKVRDDR